MGQSKYTVFIPSHAKSVAIAAHHYLTMGPLAVKGATVHHGTPYDTLIAYAEDTPEMDSHMKQLGVFVGEVANTQVVTVAKEGKNIATWQMRNPFYQPPQLQVPNAPMEAPQVVPNANVPQQPVAP